MTISESIKKWLYQYPEIDIDENINTELLEAESIAYAISKTPNSTVSEFIDGTQIRTEYYMFFVRQHTQLDIDRISNNQFLEDLESWIDDKNHNGDMPKLDKNRYCNNISVSSGYYLFETNESESVYTLTIEIIYRKEIYK